MIVSDNSTIWAIASILQLVSNSLMEVGNIEEGRVTGIIASALWILATFRFANQVPQQKNGRGIMGTLKRFIPYNKENIGPLALLTGSALFLASYLVSVPKDSDPMPALKTVWGLAIAGGLCFCVGATKAFMDTKGLPNAQPGLVFVPLGAFCFAIGAFLTMISMGLNFITKTSVADLGKSSSMPNISATFLLIGALFWVKLNIMPPPAPAAEPSSSSSSRSNVEQRLLDRMRRRR
jgi:hypothetical protein